MPLNSEGKPCGRGSPGVKVAGRKFSIYRETEPARIPDEVINALFMQALVGNYPGEPYLDVLRRFTRLVEAELAGTVA